MNTNDSQYTEDLGAVSQPAQKRCVCCDCGHTQDEMVTCAQCGSIRTVLLSWIISVVGKDWRKNFEAADSTPPEKA